MVIVFFIGLLIFSGFVIWFTHTYCLYKPWYLCLLCLLFKKLFTIKRRGAWEDATLFLHGLKWYIALVNSSRFGIGLVWFNSALFVYFIHNLSLLGGLPCFWLKKPPYKLGLLGGLLEKKHVVKFGYSGLLNYFSKKNSPIIGLFFYTISAHFSSISHFTSCKLKRADNSQLAKYSCLVLR